jgi:aminoglycoside phosphotransferase (APT) family kinase protein
MVSTLSPLEARNRFVDWLAARVGAPVDVKGVTTPQHGGMSHDTLLLDATWDGTTHGLVVRAEPVGPPIFPEYDLATEHAVMAALHEKTGVPVPAVRWFEDDTAVLGRRFFVMDRVDGEVPSDNPPFLLGGFLFDAPHDHQGDAQRAVVDVLAAIHRVDWESLGLAETLDRSAFGRHPGLDQEIGYWRAYLDWAASDGPLPVLEAVFDWCIAQRLEEPEPALCWGDARYGNIVFADLVPVAVLDWEMAMLGPPELDLGWFVFLHETALMWMPDLPGFGSRGDVIRRYELSLGREVVNLRWYEVWAGMRAAAIQAQLVRRAHVLGHVPDLSGREQTAAVASLRRLVDLP